jgi:murein hydrolase activator
MKVLTLFLFILPLTVRASDVIFDLAEKYNKSKNELLDIEIKKRKILSEIYGIEKETRQIVVEKNDLDEKKVQLDHDLIKISKKIVETEDELKQITPELIRRTTILEKVKDLPWFYVLITAQSISDLDQMFKMATHLNKQQSQLLDYYIEIHSKLIQDKKVLIETAQNIVSLKKKISLKEKMIEGNQTNKMKVLQSLDFTLDSKKRSLMFLKILGRNAVENSEFKNLGLLFGSNFFEKKGKLTHPVEGEIIQNFGLINNLSHDQFELMHKGYFYNTKDQAPVHSIADGRVKYIGNLPGYGQTVIIDHGGRYYTVYSNLKKISVAYNNTIQTSQVIGETGNDHILFKKGLYFEIRHFSQPQNPEHWLELQRSKLATL